MEDGFLGFQGASDCCNGSVAPCMLIGETVKVLTVASLCLCLGYFGWMSSSVAAPCVRIVRSGCGERSVWIRRLARTWDEWGVFGIRMYFRCNKLMYVGLFRYENGSPFDYVDPSLLSGSTRLKAPQISGFLSVIETYVQNIRCLPPMPAQESIPDER